MKIESGLLTSGSEVFPTMQNDASKVKDAAAQFEALRGSDTRAVTFAACSKGQTLG